MKVLIVSAAFPPIPYTGANYVMRLCNELQSRGVQVHVIGPATATIDWADFIVGPMLEDWNWKEMNTILDYVHSVKPNIVDIFFSAALYRDHPMITFLPTFIKRIEPATRVIVHFDRADGIIRSESRFVTAACRAICSFVVGRSGLPYEYGSLLKDSDGVVFLSERDQQRLVHSQLDLRLLEKSAVIAAPHAMPIAKKISTAEREAKRTKIGVSSNEFVAAFIGSVEPGNGIEYLLRAVAELIMTGRRVKLLLIGNVPEAYYLRREGREDYSKEIKELIELPSLKNNVIWMDDSEFDSQVPSQSLRIADCCILPFCRGVDRSESSVSFAAAHQLPIITTHGEATESIFQNKKNVILCQGSDFKGIKEAIEQLIDHTALRVALATNVGKLAQSAVTWESCARETLAMYSSELPPLNFIPDQVEES